MLDYIIELFRDNQVIPIFLTIGLGFWLGNLRIKSFSLGPVTATLLVGVLIGQIGIEISDTVKSLFFVLFLFAIGYSVGPQFFRSLKGDGIKQIAFAVTEGLLCVWEFASSWLNSWATTPGPLSAYLPARRPCRLLSAWDQTPYVLSD